MTRREFGATMAASLPVRAAAPLPLILDTDIGGDIDDALALIYLLHSPAIALRGVTTVSGDTTRKAEFARQIIGTARVPCYAGSGVPLVRHDRSALAAVDYLIEATREPGGPRHLLVVGSETNVALALIRDPSMARRLEGITLMGYDFKTGVDRYNIGWDKEAARHVLESGIPLRVLPIEIGVACQMNQAEYDACQASTCPHMEVIKKPMREWVAKVRSRASAPIPDYLPRPYDSLAAMTLTDPELFEWKRGIVHLEPNRLEPRPDGPHRIVAAVDREKVMSLHQQRLTSCGQGGAANSSSR